MMDTTNQTSPKPPPITRGIQESHHGGCVILSPVSGRTKCRIIYLENYGGSKMWEKMKKGEIPGHHLRGCLELVRMGYEVALAEPLPDFYLRKKPFPHDLRLIKPVKEWLGKDGIVFCGHNVLYWLPFLRALRLVNCRIVSHLFSREPLNWAKAHQGIIALTPAAAEQAKKLAPNAKVAHLGWGCDLTAFPSLPYNPEAFFSCGIASRDHKTLSAAGARTKQPIEVICAGISPDLKWSSNVRVVDGGKGWNFEDKKLGFQELLHKHYGRSAGSLIIINNDPTQYLAIGFTEMLEVMAMARPVIMTRTGAMATELDIEKTGWGLYVPPQDPAALAEAINYLGSDLTRAEEMGKAGRRLAETHYNIERYARDLDAFFSTL